MRLGNSFSNLYCNNNRQSNPQFGMALKIERGGNEYINSLSKKGLEVLTHAAEDMKDFKRANLIIGNQGPYIELNDVSDVVFRNPRPAQWLSFDTNPHTSLFTLDFDCFTRGGKKSPSYDGSWFSLSFSNPSRAKKAYSELAATPKESIERYVDATKMLEKCKGQLYSEDFSAMQAESAQLKTLRDNLIDGYSVQ